MLYEDKSLEPLSSKQLRARCEIERDDARLIVATNYVTMRGPDGRDWRCRVAYDYTVSAWQIVDIDGLYEEDDPDGELGTWLDFHLEYDGYADEIESLINEYNKQEPDPAPRWSSKRECVI